ncbi:MAG: imidazole glycerol phosphate synthase cyclase subunit [Moritella sp.]|uniref:imidazole glycerol phosphate synthase subunit HisF n=1 Tax=Moritella sp. TaxID=78556 RepID=UPI0029B12DF8|nr:imidazole glycerol phosphate synthase cyclase subunit [Moritella sp.]MDX2320727.1 imidazole glycerol phosphate synthase cyclase subunit [Moritella sp.]
MLRKRIIPIVLLDGFSVLKTINFNQRRNLGSPITVARTYNTRNVDELVLLDIDASKQGRAIDKFTIAEIAQDCFMPLTVGGGITSIKDIQDLLARGADKVAINTFAIKNPLFIKESADIFGSQCIVVSIDVVKDNDNYLIYSGGKINDDLELVSWIKQVEELGAGELIINNVTKDGTMSGGDAVLAELVASNVSIPVIYVGGISNPKNASEIAQTNVSAVGIASLFHFTDFTPSDCSAQLRKDRIPVR